MNCNVLLYVFLEQFERGDFIWTTIFHLTIVGRKILRMVWGGGKKGSVETIR